MTVTYLSNAFSGGITSAALLLAAAALAVILGLVYGIKRWRFWVNEGEKLSKTGGYVTPYVSRVARLVLCLVSHIRGPYILGGITVQGAKRLHKTKTRLIICPNHQFEHDAIVLSYLIGTKRWRFLSAIDQCQGFRSPWFAWIGIIPVDHTTLRGRVKVLTSVVEALKKEAGSSFVIFPQGKLVEDDVLLRDDWNTGPAIMGTKAAAATGDKFALIAAHIQYITDPAQAKLWQRLLAKIGLKREFCGRTVYGCRVVIGEEIAAPADGDKDQLTDQLFAATVALKGSVH
jgi:Acyltransferase